MRSGISAYAFQGTNAHAVVASAPAAAPGPDGAVPNASVPALVTWQRDWQFVAPPVHIMLTRVRSLPGRRAQLLMDCHLSATPRLAYFWDHRVGGRVLFPGGWVGDGWVVHAELFRSSKNTVS